MRVCCRFALVFGLATLLAAPVLSQQPQRGQRGGGGGGPGSVASLLQNESVQTELKVDKDQAEKVKEAVQQVQDKHKDEFAKLRDLSQEERRTEGQKLSRTVSEEILKAADTILKPDQIKRLKQIELQQLGTQAFTRPEVQTALSLKDDQKEKVKAIADAAATEMRELRQGGNQQQGNREKIAAIRKETQEKIQAVLTDDQKKTWKDMTGDPFQMPQRRRSGNNNNQL
ncbi:MAG TPA: hypothetical protein VGZ25_00715 [Gemmataceae bacterium]|nr:hypothetical protein [Gemmataceae bacterium]